MKLIVDLDLGIAAFGDKATVYFSQKGRNASSTVTLCSPQSGWVRVI